MSHEYENLGRIGYGDADSEHGKALFVPVCPTCARFVKPDEKSKFDADGQLKEPNATCKKCGRVEMPFEGWF
jgi:hypothetical protein